MDRSNLCRLNRIVEDTENKVKMLNDYEIEDPWYTGNFDKVYEEIKEGIEKIRK
ncbi:MAG: low molecular weight phosphotyrosine protein phosphatase, partial [Erysipelotrichaceae bacterium]|nr:low molecular weight phosphotyrosine protein phosphatase [Erysipelotrichaceae bacterium]